MITLIITVILLSAVIGVAAYLIIGSWIAFLIAFLGSIIAVCVTVGVVKLIKYLKK